MKFMYDTPQISTLISCSVIASQRHRKARNISRAPTKIGGTGFFKTFQFLLDGNILENFPNFKSLVAITELP